MANTFYDNYIKIFKLQGVSLPERGENKDTFNELIKNLLETFCREGDLNLGQITEDQQEIEQHEQARRKVIEVDKEREKKEREKRRREEQELEKKRIGDERTKVIQEKARQLQQQKVVQLMMLVMAVGVMGMFLFMRKK